MTSRIFTTEVGVRPAEPCSISVVATHQLLTNIFEHICEFHFFLLFDSRFLLLRVYTLTPLSFSNLLYYFSGVTIIGNPHFRSISGSIITERDLQTLEKLNRDNIKSLERIVGVDRKGNELRDVVDTEKVLRSAGDVWAEHILENAKAYIMSFIYIVVTVTIGTNICSC